MPRRVRLALASSAAVLAAGLIRFALAHPTLEVRFPRAAADPPGRHDLADFRYGPVVRASSAAWAEHAHPGYVVDRVAAPSSREAWASAADDAAPWLEVELDRPRAIDEVVLARPVPAHPYKLECFARATVVASTFVSDDRGARGRHPLACPGADRVRVTFAGAGPDRGGPVRVDELEVWGS